MNANLDIDTINHALSKVIGDLMTNMTAAERNAVKNDAMVYSAGVRLSANVRRSMMSGCADARAEAAHLAAGEGTFEVELLARSGGKLKSVQGLVVVQLEDGRTAAATKDGRAIYTVIDGHLKRRPCSLDMTTAAPKGLEALMAHFRKRTATKVEGSRVIIRPNLTDEEMGLSIVDMSDEAMDTQTRRCLELIRVYFDVAWTAITGDHATPKEERTIEFGSGNANEAVLLHKFRQMIGPEREGVILHFKDKLTEGPTEATVTANRGGVHYTQRGCRPWMAAADSPLVFTLVSPSGRKSHFAFDGEGGLEQKEGHPAEDLSHGYEIARNTLADAAALRFINQNPDLLKQAA